MSDRPPEEVTAWANILRQHDDGPGIEPLIKALHAPLTPIAAALLGLQSAHDFDLAQGARLDLIGSIVGASRDLPDGVVIPWFGFASQPGARGFGRARMRSRGDAVSTSYRAPDPEFRALIRAKIALNNAHGTAGDIAAAARGHYGAEAASVRDAGPARIRVWVGPIPNPDNPLGRIKPTLPTAAGVSFETVFYAPGRTFGFRGKPGAVGFGKGPMARTPPSNRAPL